MKPLTKSFIEELGFLYEGTTFEVDADPKFHYDEYVHNGKDPFLAVFFNYFDNGKETIDVVLDDADLINVGRDELKTLVGIIPDSNTPTK